VHRDVKPANIWVEAETDRIKILDFGLALAQVPVDRLAGRGTVIGTPQYLSPEQARSEPLDNRTDLYSLGVVLFELCTGRLPFRVRTVPEQLIATLIRQPPSVHEVNPEIPEPLSQLIAHLMAKEPRQRFRSAAELDKRLAEVAVECEAKTDVAQTISKLQQQLNLVAVKQPDPFVTAVAPVEAMPDPFAALPTMVHTVAASPAARPPSSPGVPARPIQAGAPTRSRPTQQAAKKTGFQLPSYWPWIAAGASAIAFLGVIQWVFISSSGTPHANSTVIVSGSPDGSEAPGANPGPDPSANQPSVTAPSQPQPKPQSPESGKGQSGGDKKKKQGKNNADNQSKDHSTVDPGRSSTQEVSVSPSLSEPSLSEPDRMMVRSPDTVPETPMVDTGTTNPANSPMVENPSPIGPAVASRAGVSTKEGRGADTTVRKGAGSREQLGQSLSVVIQRRAKIDIQHAYLRFDLGEGSKKKLAKVIEATLAVSFPNQQAPAGAEVRVYGIPAEVPDDWTEVGPRALSWSKSLSEFGLQSLPLVAEATLTGKEGSTGLTFSDPRMVSFIQGIDENFVSFVLAGGSADGKPLHIISREGNASLAPKLELGMRE
jgi:serine/threonine protein kinase